MNWYEREQLQARYEGFVAEMSQIINDFVSSNFSRELDQQNAQRQLRKVLDNHLQNCRKCLFYNSQVSCDEICDFEGAWQQLYNQAQGLVSNPTVAENFFSLSKIN